MKTTSVYQIDWEYNFDNTNETVRAAALEESKSVPMVVLADSYVEAFNKVANLTFTYFKVSKVDVLVKNANLME